MPKKRKKKRRVVRPIQGSNLIVTLGLPRDTLAWVQSNFEGDTSQRSARFVGAPSPLNDWGHLYRKKTLSEILTIIERESRAIVPHRIIVLYVPSRDADNLIATLSPVCYLAPLHSEGDDLRYDGSTIGWRHDKQVARSVVSQVLQNSLKATNALKAEITDKRISPFTLPRYNFYFPNRHTTIGDVYLQIARHTSKAAELRHRLLPARFTRNQLTSRAFKGQQYADEFFQDTKGRIFPPDLFHAHNTINDKEALTDGLSVVVRQRYRFGVTVRNGNLHYDMQYEFPRKLNKERMYCAIDGEVMVTGSHANVGVNDVIWVPGGKKETHCGE